jgi:hypothetical protein
MDICFSFSINEHLVKEERNYEATLAEIKIDHEHFIGGIGFVKTVQSLDVTLQLLSRRLDEKENGFIPYFQMQAASGEQP